MFHFSLTRLAIAAFVVYISYTAYSMYSIFQLPKCSGRGNCLKPFVNKNPKLAIEISVSNQKRISSSLKNIWMYNNFTIDEKAEKSVTVKVPKIVRNNGTMYVHSFLYVHGEDPHTSYLSHDVSAITTFALPQSSFVNLLGSGGQNVNGTKQDSGPKSSSHSSDNKKDESIRPHSHWRPRLTVCVMGEKDLLIDRTQVPPEIYQHLRLHRDGSYLPIVYIDELGYRLKDLLPLNETSSEMPLTITYSPISMGKLRLWIHISQSFTMLRGLGFTEKDTDEVKGIFADTNFYFLILTFFVAAFHMLFDFLAFKNDISYWKARKTMVGLSSRVVIWRCISTTIIFLYLMDQETSLLVLIPAGIGTFIEIWKVTKAFKVDIKWNGYVPKLQFGSSSDQEKETQEFDSQAMKYLSYVLYPLCIGGAIYSLIYVKHKSWYSWCINSLVNGVYAFGFLFMMPQLFVNYKMKSVAHLPWRAFMYKAFNTFIDDIFAFIITMPTAHRLACFRDDIIFLVYLYQRWLYPVDKTRANEFGQSFEDEQNKKQQSTQQKKPNQEEPKVRLKKTEKQDHQKEPQEEKNPQKEQEDQQEQKQQQIEEEPEQQQRQRHPQQQQQQQDNKQQQQEQLQEEKQEPEKPQEDESKKTK